MKVMLIVPPNIFNKGENYFITVPLGLAYLGAVLEKKHEVKILDSLIENPYPENISKNMYRVGLNFNSIKKKIENYNPDIVNITDIYTVQHENVIKVAEIVKEIKDIPVVVGGANASVLPKIILKNKNIDFVIIGEGEESINKLIDCLEKKKSFNKIDGLGYKKGNKIFINSKKNYIRDIDKLPFPARHLLPMKDYFKYSKEHALFSKRKPHTTMITSRGCPGKCVFCSIHSVWGNYWRGRSPKDVVNEIESLVKEYGIKEIHFEDDNLTLDKERIRKICDEIIKRRLDITWTTPNGIFINNLDEELLKKMKRSGCYRLFIGIESGNQFILNNVIKKNISLEKTKEVISLLKKLKIEITGFFVIGLPGETKGNIKETIDFANKFDFDRILISIATPYPGTELYKICLEKNYLYDKDISKLKPKFASISTEEFTKEEIEKLRNIGYFKFQINKMKRHPFKYFITLHNYSTLLRYSRFFINRLYER